MRKRKGKKEKGELIASGVLRVHPRGFGFLVPEDRERFPEDIFVPRHLTGGAVDGDQVEVAVNTRVISEKGPEGAVSSILRRGRSHVGGTITFALPQGGGYAHVPLLGPDQEMRILPTNGRVLEGGDRIVIRVLQWGSRKEEPLGEMSAYIGHISDPSCDIDAAIEEYELEDAFSKPLLKEVQAFGEEVSPADRKGREDLRSLECFTIDPDTARDFDDALSLSQDEKGYFHLGVHIADVSHYVRPGTLVDKEAKERCNSTYFPGRVLPMLPHELSSHLCSLKEGVNRLTVSVHMVFDQEGTLKRYRISRSVIKSAKRFTYKEALQVLEGKKKSKQAQTLFLMVDLCHRLKQKRYQRGSIEFSLPEVSLKIDKGGMPEKVEIIEYDITHQLVEEFMLQANEVVATHLAKEGKPLTYRIHEEPAEENIRDFALLAQTFGFKISPQPTTQELQLLFDEARSTPFGQFLATAFIRSLRLANYSTQNVGHYGLGLEYYTHFTSPIRRYVDLIVHRVLFDEIDAETDLEEVALQCSERERLSAKAENSVKHLKKLRLLHAEQKKDPDQTFEAVITTIKPFGFAFEVTRFLLEGFIPLSAINSDYFVFEERTKLLQGLHTGRRFRSGDGISVAIESVNFITGETAWRLLPQKKRKSGKKEIR